MTFLRFVRELLRAAFHACRESYYALALRHCGHDHPDAPIITNRLLRSQMVVNDFLRGRL